MVNLRKDIPIISQDALMNGILGSCWNSVQQSVRNRGERVNQDHFNKAVELHESSDRAIIQTLLESNNKNFVICSNHLQQVIKSGNCILTGRFLRSENQDFQVSVEHLIAAIKSDTPPMVIVLLAMENPNVTKTTEDTNPYYTHHLRRDFNFLELTKNISFNEMATLATLLEGVSCCKMKNFIGVDNINTILVKYGEAQVGLVGPGVGAAI